MCLFKLAGLRRGGGGWGADKDKEQIDVERRGEAVKSSQKESKVVKVERKVEKDGTVRLR